MSFPRKPLLDRVIVREIPLDEIFQQSEVQIPLDDVRVKLRSDRGVVVSVGDCVPIGGAILPMPVEVGDTVFYDEFCLCDPVYLNPGDQYRHDLPKYWQMRVGDLKGVAVKKTAEDIIWEVQKEVFSEKEDFKSA